MAIRLIVGLGNPGNDYTATRHNAGFWFIAELLAQYGAQMVREAKFFGSTAKITIKDQEVFLLKPHTFMNRSGQAVAALANFFKISPEEILVVHDELDFLPGIIKLKHKGSAAGHNGLKSIIASIGSADFWRLRIGIGHPRDFALPHSVADFVLQLPSTLDRNKINQAIEKGSDIMQLLVSGKAEDAMMILHTA